MTANKNPKHDLMVMLGCMTRTASTELTREERRSVRAECFDCAHRRNVPGNAHIRCVKPDADMVGNPHGIKNGWFMYPLLFDPTWKEKSCVNYEPTSAVSSPVSSAGKSE